MRSRQAPKDRLRTQSTGGTRASCGGTQAVAWGIASRPREGKGGGAGAQGAGAPDAPVERERPWG